MDALVHLGYRWLSHKHTGRRRRAVPALPSEICAATESLRVPDRTPPIALRGMSGKPAGAPVSDPHVTIVGARTDGQNGVRWLFRYRNGGNVNSPPRQDHLSDPRWLPNL